MITHGEWVREKAVSKILLHTEFMSNFVGISNPICLELPELALCRGNCPAPPVLEDSGVCRSRSAVMLPCVSLAAALHGALVFLALTMAMGVGEPRSVIGISLLPAMGSGTGAPCEPSLVEGAPSAIAAPVTARHADPVASSGASQKPNKSAAAVKKSASARIAPEKPVKASAVAIRADTELRDPVPRVMTAVMRAPATEAVLQDPVPSGDDQDSGNRGVAAGIAVPRTAMAVAAGSHASDASAASGVKGGPGDGGTGAAGGPVGASFGDGDGPRFVQRIVPRYPELARRRGREGVVLLRLVIGSGGELRDARVVEGGGHGFDEAALAAVRASVYAPAMRGGQGVECAALLPIRFALKGS